MPLVEIGRRSITDFGILDMDTLTHPIHGGIQDWTRIQIWTVLRGKQSNPYVNLEWNPDQGFLGRMTVAATGDLGAQNPPILSDKGIRYEIELIYEWEDSSRMTNVLINCATQKILLTIQSLATVLGAPTVSFVPLPLPPLQRCPASIIRVKCQSDAQLDIVVFAENAIALLSPADALCASMLQAPFADAVPSPSDPANDQDPAPPPGQQPTPGSPPYDPSTGDDGETPLAPTPVPPPGSIVMLQGWQIFAIPSVQVAGFAVGCPAASLAISIPVLAGVQNPINLGVKPIQVDSQGRAFSSSVLAAFPGFEFGNHFFSANPSCGVTGTI